MLAIGLTAAGCSSGSQPVGDRSPQPTAHPHSLVDAARELANADHTHHYRVYLGLLRGRHRQCRTGDPVQLASLVSPTTDSLISYRGQGLSRLSVLRSLTGGIAPKGPLASCVTVAHALVAELRPADHKRSPFAGFYGSTTAWRAAHRPDPRRQGAYLPRLPNGLDSFAMSGSSIVTYLARNFDPAVSQDLALASIRAQLLPAGHLRVIYSLDMASNCSETVYLSRAIERLMSSASGVQVELTSGHGISSHYDPNTVNHARLTVGRGALGGQPCV
jgi:hypothetical protein